MPRDVTEVLVGPGTLYTAPLGEAFPANPQTTPAGNWVEIGYSEDGWTVEADKTFEDVLVAEEVDPIATYKTAQSIRLTGEMAQASLANLQLAFGGGTISTDTPAAGYDTYQPPASDTFSEYAVLLRTVAPGNTSWLRDWQFTRAVAAGAVAAQFTKAPQKANVAMEFTVLKPSAGDIFKVIDQTA